VQRRLLPALLIALTLGGAAAPAPTVARSSRAHPKDVIGSIAEASLPKEARRTLALIRRGGPFPYSRDGVVFENRERRLPEASRGYYHEYTVSTPGARDRGPRRIVTGGDGSTYWSPDHYRTFSRVEPAS
jgi:ribonuclease T1